MRIKTKQSEKSALFAALVITFVVIILFGLSDQIFCDTIVCQNTNKISENDLLTEILIKSGTYCERLKAVALHFVCTEEVKEKIHKPYRILDSRWRIRGLKYTTENNKYVYDYQLIRKEDPEELRTLLQANKKRLRQENAWLKTKRFYYEYIIFGPIGLLGQDEQKEYDYTLLEPNKRLWGRSVCILEASPRKKEESDSLYGKIWVDKDNGSVLKIEWEDQSLKNYTALVQDAKRYNAKLKLSFVSEYKIEKNGIQFPSRYYVKEFLSRFNTIRYTNTIYTTSRPERMEKSELEVKYKDYKFFIVETEIKYGTDQIDPERE